MAQFYFKYSSMGAGKSIEILKVAHNYEEQNKKVLLLTPSVDTRKGEGVIWSRVGISREATVIYPTTDIVSLLGDLGHTVHCVLIDEAQFLTREQVIQLAAVVDTLGTPVMAFGLKNDFKNNLFEGTEALLVFADKIEEMKTICARPDCGKKATMNGRFSDGKLVTSGSQIQIGDEEYSPLCRKHYFELS